MQLHTLKSLSMYYHIGQICTTYLVNTNDDIDAINSSNRTIYYHFACDQTHEKIYILSLY